MAVRKKRMTRTKALKSSIKSVSKPPRTYARSNKEGIAASAYDIAKAGQLKNPISIIRMINGVRTPIRTSNRNNRSK